MPHHVSPIYGLIYICLGSRILTRTVLLFTSRYNHHRRASQRQSHIQMHRCTRKSQRPSSPLVDPSFPEESSLSIFGRARDCRPESFLCCNKSEHHSYQQPTQHLQSSKHVTRRDAIYSDPSMGPLHRQRAGQMPHRSLCGIVRRLWLRDINNGTAHTPNENDAA